MVWRKGNNKMERTTIVPDASVIVKWFTQEEKREQAIELREKHINGEIGIVVPDLILYEISNALRYNPNFNQNDINKAIQSLFDIEINIITPTLEILERTIEIAYSKEISIYDATYIALAEIINFGFITADKKLLRKTNDLGFVYLL